MKKEEAKQQVENTFNNPFDEGRFRTFAGNLLKGMEKPSTETVSGAQIKEAFRSHIKSYTRIGKYTSPDKEVLDVVAINLMSGAKLDRARTMQRVRLVRLGTSLLSLQ